MFAKRIEKVKKAKFDLELIKIVDCFLDGHGSYDSNLVSFKIKSFNKQSFLLQLIRVMSLPKEYEMLVKKEIPKQKVQSLVTLGNKIFTTCQILKEFFYSASAFEIKFLRQVRFQNKNYTTRQISK